MSSSEPPLTREVEIGSCAISLLVRQPSLAPLARDLPAIDVALSDEAALLFTLLERLTANPSAQVGTLLESLRDSPLWPLLEEVMGLPMLLDETQWEAEFSGAIEQLLKQRQRQRYRRLVSEKSRLSGVDHELPGAPGV